MPDFHRSDRLHLSCQLSAAPSRSAIDHVSQVSPCKQGRLCSRCRPQSSAILWPRLSINCRVDGATAFAPNSHRHLAGGSSQPFSQPLAGLGSSGALRRCTCGGMIVGALFGKPSVWSPGKRTAEAHVTRTAGIEGKTSSGSALSSNSALHRTADHKVHGRGRALSAFDLLLRARVLKRRRAAAEPGS
jgi:hypothetical protein